MRYQPSRSSTRISESKPAPIEGFFTLVPVVRYPVPAEDYYPHVPPQHWRLWPWFRVNKITPPKQGYAEAKFRDNFKVRFSKSYQRQLALLAQTLPDDAIKWLAEHQEQLRETPSEKKDLPFFFEAVNSEPFLRTCAGIVALLYPNISGYRKERNRELVARRKKALTYAEKLLAALAHAKPDAAIGRAFNRTRSSITKIRDEAAEMVRTEHKLEAEGDTAFEADRRYVLENFDDFVFAASVVDDSEVMS